MLDQDILIHLLNQPGVQSGTALGEALGVSRVAVQQRIHQLVENGLPIEAVPGKGYTLADGVYLLEGEQIQSLMRHALVLESIDVLQTIPSTNTYLLGQSILPARARICLAEAQTVGRGRRGNDWQSSAYRNVMLSMSWGFFSWPETITGLGLAVALTVAERLNATHGLDVNIKWPNDLMVGKNKLGGILIDVAGESSGVCNVVIGLGLNVHQADWSQADADYAWQDLAGLGVKADRNELVANILDAWIDMLVEFEESGFEPLMGRWNALNCYAEQEIRVGNDEAQIVGEMLGVDAVGAMLVVDAQGETHRFADSNVSVRLV